MITIQSGMLVALGFLTAALLGLLLAPAFWSRAVRLTTRRLKESMPLSEMEIEADRDRIRAEYAIKMHKLETLVEQVKMAAARQQIEINRRDARVNVLEGDLDQLKARYEEAQNARRVLEQTIADRLPRVESRLTDAKKLLHSRDREISEMTGSLDRQRRALAEATSINTQQKREISNLEASLAARATNGSGSRSETETALRAELEALRAKSREQAQLLSRMQSLAGRSAAAPQTDSAANSANGTGAALVAGPAAAGQSEIERQLRAAQARNDDQAGEIARLKAAVAVFESESGDGGRGSLKESRLGLKARVQSLEAQTNRQSETIQKLRNELAAANERIARQADHFTGELRRLGNTGGQPAISRGRRSAPAAQLQPVMQGATDGVASDVSETAASPAPHGLPLIDTEGGTADRSVVDTADLEMAEADAGAPVLVGVTANDGKAATAESASSGAAASSGRPRLIDRIAGLSRGS
ncbi:MAG: hypothetical protein R3D67_05105 [Hyphomicrobiaceae bacterium]